MIDLVRQLFTLRGIGVHSAWLCVMACFAWLDFQTPKQVGAVAGLTPTPYQSFSRRLRVHTGLGAWRPRRRHG